MTTQLQLRRGTTAEHATFTGAQGEVTQNTTTKRLHSHDGSTAGGLPLALLSDLPTGVPSGGSQGQVLTKNSATNGDLVWVTPTPTNVTTIQNRTVTSAYTLQLGDAYLRMSYNSGTVVINIPTHAAVPFPIGTQITAIWVDCNAMSISFSSGVTYTTPDSLNLRKPGSSVTMTKVAQNHWDIAGDMRVS